MKRAFVAGIAMLALSAQADDMVASNGTDSVRLTQQPCPPAILATIPPQFQAQAKAASASVSGTSYTACWVASGSYVVLQYEDGDTGVIPMSQFRRSPGV